MTLICINAHSTLIVAQGNRCMPEEAGKKRAYKKGRKGLTRFFLFLSSSCRILTVNHFVLEPPLIHRTGPRN